MIFACVQVWSIEFDSGTFYGIFDDINTMKKQYKIIQEISNDETLDEIEFHFSKPEIHENVRTGEKFVFSDQTFVLIRPDKKRKYAIEYREGDKRSSKDRLLIFLDENDDEPGMIYLLKNRFAYSEEICWTDMDTVNKALNI